MTRALKAKENFESGYACSQSVVMAFSDLVGIDESTLKKLSLPLGGGLGRLRLTCGAINGIAIIVGLIFSSAERDDENKTYVYSIIQELVKRFEHEKQTINCKELLEKASLDVEIAGTPESRNNEYYKKRPCGSVVYTAAYILEQFLMEKGII